LYSDEAPKYGTVINWFYELNRGRRSLEDEGREGRSKTVVVPEYIDAESFLSFLGISSTTSIHSILH